MHSFSDPAVPVPNNVIPAGRDWRRIFFTGLQIAGTAGIGYAAVTTGGLLLPGLPAFPFVGAAKVKVVSYVSAKSPAIGSAITWVTGPATSARVVRAAVTVVGYYSTGQIIEVIVENDTFTMFQAVDLAALVRLSRLVQVPRSREVILQEILKTIAASFGTTLSFLAAHYAIILGPLNVGTIETAIAAGKGAQMCVAYLIRRNHSNDPPSAHRGLNAPHPTNPNIPHAPTSACGSAASSNSEDEDSDDEFIGELGNIMPGDDFTRSTGGDLLGIPVPVYLPIWAP